MPEYVPTDAEVREYVVNGGEYRPWDAPDLEVEERRAAAWDRWLAAHDAAVKAGALREAADEWSEWEVFDDTDGCRSIRKHGNDLDDWLRKRADQIEAEK